MEAAVGVVQPRKSGRCFATMKLRDQASGLSSEDASAADEAESNVTRRSSTDRRVEYAPHEAPQVILNVKSKDVVGKAFAEARTHVGRPMLRLGCRLRS